MLNNPLSMTGSDGMRTLKFSGAALAAMMIAQPALADIDPTVGAPPVPATVTTMPPPTSGSMGGADERRSVARSAALPQSAVPAMPAPPPPPVMQHSRSAMNPAAVPSAYARPAYGYQLPSYWMAPEFFIADPRAYGLGRPAPGFGWSRYYDDAVLTDQWGRVYDARSRGDWGRGGRGRNSHDADAAVAGVSGAAVGAVAGNLIAGAGSRLAGSLIGGGVGALAGLAIEAVTSKHRREHRDDRRGGYRDREYGYDDGDYYGRGSGYRGAHWGGGYGSYGVACNCGDDVVTTTVTRTSWGGGGVMVPRQVVTYENVYAPVRVAAPTKMKERRTTKLRPRVRGDY
jgi:Ni/Co efflux regulator RcnB